MQFDDDENIKKSADIVVGEDLSSYSIDELEKRITYLKSEICRIEADIEHKRTTKSAADKFFS